MEYTSDFPLQFQGFVSAAYPELPMALVSYAVYRATI